MVYLRVTALNRLRINRIILGMCTDEPDIHHPVRIVDPDNQAVLVTANVKDHPAVVQNARSWGLF